MLPRAAKDIEAVRHLLTPFFREHYALFPVLGGNKRPRDTGWQTRKYSQSELKRWVTEGGNVGVALQASDLVIDVDPRNFATGDEPFARLCDELGVDLADAPTVLSGRGDGGRHIYFRKPAAFRIKGKLKGYEGIDFKSKGGFVLAPGSMHPETGGVYMPADSAPPIGDVRMAPKSLLQRLTCRHTASATPSVAGKISPEQLALLLSGLDPADFGRGRYDEWIRLAAACHDATSGAGMPVWLEWCADDPAYGDDATFDSNVRVWESFTAGRRGGATYRTLLKAVVDAGRPDLVATFDSDDALEENFLVHEIETDEKHDG